MPACYARHTALPGGGMGLPYPGGWEESGTVHSSNKKKTPFQNSHGWNYPLSSRAKNTPRPRGGATKFFLYKKKNPTPPLPPPPPPPPPKKKKTRTTECSKFKPHSPKTPQTVHLKSLVHKNWHSFPLRICLHSLPFSLSLSHLHSPPLPSPSSSFFRSFFLSFLGVKSFFITSNQSPPSLFCISLFCSQQSCSNSTQQLLSSLSRSA